MIYWLSKNTDSTRGAEGVILGEIDGAVDEPEEQTTLHWSTQSFLFLINVLLFKMIIDNARYVCHTLPGPNTVMGQRVRVMVVEWLT